MWAQQSASFFSAPAVIEYADATIVATSAETKEAMSISYNGIWGYSALLVSLANTKEPLYLGLLGAHRPSHEGVVGYFDRAIALCREADFKEIRLLGDTDYALTSQFDRFDEDGVKFVFDFDARTTLIEAAESADEKMYHQLVSRAERLASSAGACSPWSSTLSWLPSSTSPLRSCGRAGATWTPP